MKEALSQWLSERPPLEGVQATGLRDADATTATRIADPSFAHEGVENAWRCVADTFEVLRHHHCEAYSLRWRFEHSALHCLLRPDGICLMVLTTSKLQELDLAGLENLFREFQALEISTAE
jgi:hypothetical protein